MRMRLLLVALLTLIPSGYAQTNDTWKKLDFLVGKWTGMAGEKDTQQGAGQGSFSFEPQLKQQILVRRNNASYDSGAQHDDLMVIYLDAPNSTPQAIYFDSEGHVIRYSLAFPSANRVVFESESTQPGPRYRLTYWLDGASLNGKFEIGQSEKDYKLYLSWTSKKQ